MGPFEAGFRKLAKRAVGGHLPSILMFIKICEEYGVLAPPPAVTGGGVIVAPKGRLIAADSGRCLVRLQVPEGAEDEG